MDCSCCIFLFFWGGGLSHSGFGVVCRKYLGSPLLCFKELEAYL